jgi:hypothetical protein
MTYLMRKIQRQLEYSLIAPPRRGPQSSESE